MCEGRLVLPRTLRDIPCNLFDLASCIRTACTPVNKYVGSPLLEFCIYAMSIIYTPVIFGVSLLSELCRSSNWLQVVQSSTGRKFKIRGRRDTYSYRVSLVRLYVHRQTGSNHSRRSHTQTRSFCWKSNLRSPCHCNSNRLVWSAAASESRPTLLIYRG